MFKALSGWRDDPFVFQCGCVSNIPAIRKYTKPLYLLHNEHPGLQIESPHQRDFIYLLACLTLDIDFQRWMEGLKVKEDLYLSNYSKCWNVIATFNQVTPIVVERWAFINLEARKDLESSGIKASSPWPRLDMMIELKVRFLAPKQVRCSSQLSKPQK